MELSQVVGQPIPGWTPAEFAATARVAAVTLAGPPLVFAGLAITVERRLGRRWLAPLWVGALGLLLAFVAWRLASNPAAAGRMGPVGGVRGFVVAGTIMYGVQFASIAGAVSWLGAHRARPRPLWLQALGAVGAVVISLPIAVALTVATETLLSG